MGRHLRWYKLVYGQPWHPKWAILSPFTKKGWNSCKLHYTSRWSAQIFLYDWGNFIFLWVLAISSAVLCPNCFLHSLQNFSPCHSTSPPVPCPLFLFTIFSPNRLFSSSRSLLAYVHLASSETSTVALQSTRNVPTPVSEHTEQAPMCLNCCGLAQPDYLR